MQTELIDPPAEDRERRQEQRLAMHRHILTHRELRTKIFGLVVMIALLLLIWAIVVVM